MISLRAISWVVYLPARRPIERFIHEVAIDSFEVSAKAWAKRLRSTNCIEAAVIAPKIDGPIRNARRGVYRLAGIVFP